MRFTVGRLLLFFPAYFVAVAIATWWSSQVLVSYRFPYALSQARGLKSLIDFGRKLSGPQVSDDAIEQWLAGNLPADHPANHKLLTTPEVDPWGNPYKYARNVTTTDGRVEPFGVYSLGRDGISRTNGNDPDDLNSWNQDCRWYVAEINQRNRVRDAIDGALISPIVYIFFLGIGRLIGILKPLK